MENKKIIRIFIITGLILTLPFIAMQFTSQVAWTLRDFVTAGFLLAGAGLSYEFLSSRALNEQGRWATALAVGTGLLLIWVNLAVGLIGNENNPANDLYFGVIMVGLIGAGLARFRPRGMMRALFAMALTQALVPLVAMAIWRPQINFGLVQVLAVNSFFVALFIGAALMYKKASATDAP